LALQGSVKDAGGNLNTNIDPIQFTQVQEPLLVGTSYRIIKPPALAIIT